MSVLNISKDCFKKEVLDNKGIVFVDFYAEWCGPCKMVGPIIDELAESNEYKDKVKFVKINVDSNQKLATQYNVFSIPSFIIFKQGKLAHQFVGATGKEGFTNEIEKVINNP
jgi:thioredoxin 1